MKIGLELCFENNALNGSFYITLFDKYVKFSPIRFTKNYSVKNWNEKKHRKSIQESSSRDNLTISEKDNIFITADAGVQNRFRYVGIFQDKEIFFPDNKEIETIINHDHFVSGYLYDEYYSFVQSTHFESTLQGRDLPLDSIADTPFRIDGMGFKEYDISFNPGRKSLSGKTSLMAAWKMWFGRPFFEIIPKERIMGFEDAKEIKELPNGQIYVQLFEKIEESAGKINMDKQRKWREWLGFDELVRKYPA